MLPFFFVVIVLVAIAAVASRMWKYIYPELLELEDQHVMITGGSSGIGKALAIESLKRGANVTIIARDQEKLNRAKFEILNSLDYTTSCFCSILSLDLCDDPKHITQMIKSHAESVGNVDVLINCAGASVSGPFIDAPLDSFKKQLEINYLSSVYATKAIVESMKSRQKGRIVFVSSAAGQMGLYGYSAYSPSKFALRGLAESLQMELKPYSVHVTIAFPPNTDTPGFNAEKKVEPRETILISDTAGLFSPQLVADRILDDTERGTFLCSIGFDSQMLTILTCGMAPPTSFLEAFTQVFYMGIVRMISFYYLSKFASIVNNCKIERERGKEIDAKKTT